MGDLVDFDGFTKLDINPDKILDSAKDKLDSGIVIGWDKDDEFYIALSITKKSEIIYLLELAKQEILDE